MREKLFAVIARRMGYISNESHDAVVQRCVREAYDRGSADAHEKFTSKLAVPMFAARIREATETLANWYAPEVLKIAAKVLSTATFRARGNPYAPTSVSLTVERRTIAVHLNAPVARYYETEKPIGQADSGAEEVPSA